jgi:uncharacterized membrane protein (UPF0127 family)
MQIGEDDIMALRTQDPQKTVASRVVFCRTVTSQMRGLMFARKDPDRALIMVFAKEMKVPLHMMFVFFPIDILYLDSGKRMVELFEEARPFISHISPKHKARYVIELPAGAIKKNRLKVGDRLSF